MLYKEPKLVDIRQIDESILYLKEIKFNDLWNAYGVFTTMRVIGKSAKILFYKAHVDNLISSLKIYK